MRHELVTAIAAAVLAASPAHAEEVQPATQVPPGAQAQNPPTPTSRRALGGHQFLVSHLIEHPFSVTSFAQNFGLGAGEALGPAVDLATNPPTVLPGSKWYGYYGLVEQLDLTVRLMEYLSVRAGLTAGVRQGAGNGSALVVGTGVSMSGIVGVKGSLPVGDTVRLSLTGDFSYGPQINVLLLSGLVQAYQAGKFSAADLFQDRGASVAGATAAAAWAPFPWFGLVGNARYVHTKSTTIADVEGDGVVLAATAEVDALPLVPWLPLGADLAYRYTGGPWQMAGVGEWAGGLYYTGRPDLALGLELEWRTGRIETELRARQIFAWVNLRYFW